MIEGHKVKDEEDTDKTSNEPDHILGTTTCVHHMVQGMVYSTHGRIHAGRGEGGAVWSIGGR